MDDWKYWGDVNIVYGGQFIKTDRQTFKWGYAEVVEVTDLDSACGFRGACLIEKKTVNGTTDKERIRSGMQCIGMTPKDILRLKGPQAKREAIIEALTAYGFFDVESSEVVQTEHGAPMAFDGWRAEQFIEPADLKGYVESCYCD